MPAVLGEEPYAGDLADVAWGFGIRPDPLSGDPAEPAVGACLVVLFGGCARIGGDGGSFPASGQGFSLPSGALRHGVPPFSVLAEDSVCAPRDGRVFNGCA